MKRITFFALLICCFFGKLSAQNVDLQIFVTADDQPLEFATVFLTDLKTGGTTDSAGFCFIKKIPPGKHELQISYVGYATYQQSVRVKAGENILKIALTPLENALDEVVVTGTMKEVRKSESIVPVEIYTPRFFFKNPTPSFFEAMQNVNGVRPQMQCNVCNTGDIHINGMEGAYTMVLIDGMPIVSGLSTVYGLNGIPNSIVQRIEIIKGPAAALYGSEAMGGIINVITKNPSAESELLLDFNATTYAEMNADVAASFSLGKKVHSILSGNYFHFDKRYDINEDNFTDVTLAKRTSVFNKWTFDRKGGRPATVAVRYIRENRFGGELEWTPEFRGTDSIYGESIYTNRLEFIGNYQLPFEKEKVTFNYSANRHLQDSYYGTTKYYADQIISFGQLIWDKKLGKRHDLLVGLSHRYTFYDDNTAVTAGADGTTNRPQNKTQTGGFVQNEWKPTARFKLLGGLRYDYSNIHKHIFSPRVGAKFDLNQFNSLRLSAGNGFRVVNVFAEDHAALTGGREVEFLADLQPERSWNANLNYTRFQSLASGFLNIDASVFYTFYNNKIVADYLTDPDKVIFDNLQGFAENYGLALNTDWTFENGIKLIAGCTYLNAFIHENGTRQEQLQTPRFTGNYALSYTLPRIHLSFDFTGYVNSSMLLPVLPNDYRPERSPFFNISNFQITRKWNSGLEIYAGVKNVFNFFPKEDPIMRASDPFDKHADDPLENPFGYTFDPSYNYAPIQRARGFLGLRLKL